ncbi:glycoside hydrolase family 43 protein [Nonomuraea rhodomycinica]|uniref:Glycoside hydrolase family 43 protein n=1 Tax=Nonomuraea rhodomycinica TaxID=1712872 RepID=A0A7Y6MBV7_9ACTN|nr:glycoside hydrolase family 43 protein [Nonomuraea rhodomycinica]NUW41270.1 glycoside hydrolase family 43 protein [Nonomuraea rhodomycinica]
MPTFRNPVLPGCYPDPSICRAGDDFYLVTSSFAYFPGIPLFHSRDLVSWRQLTHVLDRPGPLSLEGLDVSDGIWAPTIRHHDGTFYVVSTLARNRQGSVTFVVTADDPAGPWSDPVPLEAEGIDPSLFFDDDGRCWLTACRDAVEPGGGPGELWMRELDLDRLKLVGPTHVLWHGAVRGAWVEAPHLYKRDGVYHLIAAEGGTEGNHSVTAARSDAVTGPYVTDPRSPLLTHRHRGQDEPVQNVGHVDLVDTPDGETWAVALGVRPIEGTHTLGREVFLVPVSWDARGPVFAPETGGVRLSERLPSIATGGPDSKRLPSIATGGPDDDAEHSDDPERERRDDAAPVRERFDGPVPGLEWNSLRGPVHDRVRPSADGGGLDLALSPEPLSSTGVPTFLGRRQRHVRFHARARIGFSAAHPAQEAGIAVFQNQDHHATLALTVDGGGRPRVVLTVRQAGTSTRLASAPVAAGEAVLAVEGDEDRYTFRFQDPGTDRWTSLAGVERSFFSTERAGGFVGVYLGLYATGNGRAGDGQAHVHWFEYQPATS